MYWHGLKYGSLNRAYIAIHGHDCMTVLFNIILVMDQDQ